MKISINNLSNNYSDLQIRSKETQKSFSTLSGSGTASYDQIFIQSDSRKIEESTFIDTLSGTLSKELASTHKNIAQIKSQVQNNTYQIDAQLIASRILLAGEGF